MPKYFRFAATNAKIKSPGSTRLDLGLILCEKVASVAGVFTSNAVKAAPVIIDMEIVKTGMARAVVVNSGNANACTGTAGIQDTRRIMHSVAEQLGIGPDMILPMSTGVIGEKLPVERIETAIPALIRNLGNDVESFAKAIITTDTCTKISRRSIGDASVLGIAKGSGMISPNMATTLAIILTDAIADSRELQQILNESVADTFNAITVDGDMSTNDSLLLLSSCAVQADHRDLVQAIHEVTRELAMLIVRDGEGATKLAQIEVRGAASDTDAKRAAMAVAKSPLVKTALFGEDPNWGRIIAAVGYSGIDIDPARIFMQIGDEPIVIEGERNPDYSESRAHQFMQQHDIKITISIGDGPGCFTAWTCDFSYKYVEINADYRT